MNVTILTKKSNGSLWVFLDSFNHDNITYYIVSDATDFGRSIERVDKFDMTGEALIRKAVREPSLVGKMIRSSKDSVLVGDAKCLAHFTGLFGHQYVAVKDSTGFSLVAAEYCEVVPESLDIEGGEYVVNLIKNDLSRLSDILREYSPLATANGLCYPTKESAEAAMVDIVRFCRLRRLAEMVNGDGVVRAALQCEGGDWSFITFGTLGYTVDKIFTANGAAKACELLNSGKFKL